MKIFKLMAIALVAMFGFSSCNKDCGHDFIEVDYSKDIVGAWSHFANGSAEALVINADGSVVSAGVLNGAYWEKNGTVEIKANKMTLTFEDGDKWDGRFEMVAGKALAFVNEGIGLRITYDYCANDLADEVVGMWVCNESDNGMLIRTFTEDGKVKFTGFSPEEGMYFLNSDDTYKVFGDVLFITSKIDGVSTCIGSKMAYSHDGTSLGDILVNYVYLPSGDSVKETTSWLRIKQHLELANNSYDYNNIYVTNVKAKDAEFEFAGQTLNLANMDGRILDKMMKTLLFNVSFPSADKIVYNYHYNGENVPMPSPIVVDGNKMTIKKSVNNPACKDIDVWTFQDQDNTQMHMYMSVKSFENFLANTVVEMLANDGKLDLNDAAAVKAIFDQVEAAIETINVSFIFKTAK